MIPWKTNKHYDKNDNRVSDDMICKISVHVVYFISLCDPFITVLRDMFFHPSYIFDLSWRMLYI